MDWKHLSEAPLPIGRVVAGRKADGSVIIGKTGAKPSNTLTDNAGVRCVVYHWRHLTLPEMRARLPQPRELS